MNSLEIKCPLLPDNGQIVIVELKDGTVTMARYYAEYWQEVKDLQKNFEPVGVKARRSDYIEVIFNCDIVSWKAYK